MMLGSTDPQDQVRTTITVHEDVAPPPADESAATEWSYAGRTDMRPPSLRNQMSAGGL